MFNIVICDDNKDFIEYEISILEKALIKLNVADYKINTFENGKQLLEYSLECDDINLILMDVELGEESGIKVLQDVKISRKTVIAIVSSFIDYALDGYRVNAYRYLLKSSSMLEEGFKELVAHAIELGKQIYDGNTSYDFREKSYSFEKDDLMYVESKLHYLYFHFADSKGTYSIRMKLDDVEKELNSNHFVRIHKSLLVNIKYVKIIRKHELQLVNGEKLNVSQSRYDDVLISYAEYKGE